jgi:hypothetical protein
MVHRLRRARRHIVLAISELRAARGEPEYADIESDITLLIDDIRAILFAIDDLIKEFGMLTRFGSKPEMQPFRREEEGAEEALF